MRIKRGSRSYLVFRLSKKSVIVKIDSQFHGFLLSEFNLQKWGIPNYIV